MKHDSSGLLPLGIDAKYAAQGTGQTDDSVVKAYPAEGRGGNGQVGQVGDELKPAGGSLPGGEEKKRNRSAR